MKKLLLFLLFLTIQSVRAQDVDSTVASGMNWYRTGMTATKDTVQIQFGSRFDSYTITAVSTGTDTIEVWTLSRDGDTWVQHAVTDLSTGTNAASIIATATAKEWLILDPQPRSIKLATPDGVVAVTVIFSGKMGKL